MHFTMSLLSSYASAMWSDQERMRMSPQDRANSESRNVATRGRQDEGDAQSEKRKMNTFIRWHETWRTIFTFKSYATGSDIIGLIK